MWVSWYFTPVDQKTSSKAKFCHYFDEQVRAIFLRYRVTCAQTTHYFIQRQTARLKNRNKNISIKSSVHLSNISCHSLSVQSRRGELPTNDTQTTSRVTHLYCDVTAVVTWKLPEAISLNFRLKIDHRSMSIVWVFKHALSVPNDVSATV
jgi:hypothetical protein